MKAKWKKDLAAFIAEDRPHPSVIIWSPGNEIPERGGLNNGYTRATQLAEAIRELDPTRPVSNRICSFWSGLDDAMARGRIKPECEDENHSDLWERCTEPFIWAGYCRVQLRKIFEKRP